jgi:hypothetical protein
MTDGRFRHRLPAERRAAWQSLTRDALRQAPELLDDLRDETSDDVFREGVVSLFKLLTARPVYRGLFHDFAGPASRAAVVSICDETHTPDALALVALARHLSSETCPNTLFRTVRLDNADWMIEERNQKALCFVGRPPFFFEGSKAVKAPWRNPQGRRFELPPDREGFRWKNLTPESQEHYHHIVQKRPTLGDYKHKAEERPPDTDGPAPRGRFPRRHDYGIVQRFTADIGPKITVVCIAGATSLGTLGAVLWATSDRCRENIEHSASNLNIDLSPQTVVEALITVDADIKTPTQDWEPIWAADKIFLDDNSINGFRPPKQITVKMRASCFTFDEDEVHMPEIPRAILGALCEYGYLHETRTIPFKPLLDERFWCEGRPPSITNDMKLKSSLQQNLQKKLRQGTISVHQHEAKLNFRPVVDRE